MTEQHQIDTAKMTLDYLSSLQVSESSSASRAFKIIAKSAGAGSDTINFEQMFNVVFDAIAAKVDGPKK